MACALLLSAIIIGNRPHFHSIVSTWLAGSLNAENIFPEDWAANVFQHHLQLFVFLKNAELGNNLFTHFTCNCNSNIDLHLTLIVAVIRVDIRSVWVFSSS